MVKRQWTDHPIALQSFAAIDQEIGEHHFSPTEYAIVRRAIHSTADFEFKQLLRFSPGAIENAIAALQTQIPIVVDVNMLKQGVASTIARTFANPLISAIDQAPIALPGKTRTETGLLQCWKEHPDAIFAIGNAPTALIALCNVMPAASQQPTLVIGAPVGFVSVIEAKEQLAQIAVPQIRVEGRKGGSPVAAAILNALIILAWKGTED